MHRQITRHSMFAEIEAKAIFSGSLRSLSFMNESAPGRKLKFALQCLLRNIMLKLINTGSKLRCCFYRHGNYIYCVVKPIKLLL